MRRTDTDDPIEEIADFLRRRIGLDAASVGIAAVRHAVDDRMRALGLRRLYEYENFLFQNAAEQRALVEGVVVNETWFFRERAAFDFLFNHARAEWLANLNGGARTARRILSFPCSTGEEAYSIAITLLDAGFPVERFEIDAADISGRAVDAAVRGLFPAYAFRGSSALEQVRWFESLADGTFRVDEAVRAPVRFLTDNLLAPTCVGGPALYDAIFCRNLLIYLDKETLEAVFSTVNCWLKQRGLFFVGHAETALVPTDVFERIGPGPAFAFTRRTSPVPASQPLRAARTPLPPRPSRSLTVFDHAGETETSLPELTDFFAAARIHADAGRYVEATENLRRHLRDKPADAEAWVLAGAVALATGRNTEALDALRKAVYLDPQNADALVHLAIVLEALGQKIEASRMRARAARVESTKNGGLAS